MTRPAGSVATEIEDLLGQDPFSVQNVPQKSAARFGLGSGGQPGVQKLAALAKGKVFRLRDTHLGRRQRHMHSFKRRDKTVSHQIVEQTIHQGQAVMSAARALLVQIEHALCHSKLNSNGVSAFPFNFVQASFGLLLFL
jgi:hypothetical protein